MRSATSATELSAAHARRIAIRAQALDGTARSVLDAVRRSGALQLDPTARVAPNHVLAVWSRLGRYDAKELERLLRRRTLVEFSAFIYPVETLPLMRARAAAFLAAKSAWPDRAREWLRANARYRAYVLRELKKSGPLRSDQLEDRATVSWPSSGWTSERNRIQIFELLEAAGRVMVSGRERGQRLWDLAERVAPDAPTVSTHELPQRLAERALRTLGIARPSSLRTSYMPPPDLEGIGERVRVEGTSGEWLVRPDLIEDDGPLRPLVLLSPFDRLIHDRVRTRELFGFDFTMEIYVPVAKRRWGYFVMPVLRRDRLVARIDPEVDRAVGLLRVNAVHVERGARLPTGPLRVELRSLARTLGARLDETSLRKARRRRVP